MTNPIIEQIIWLPCVISAAYACIQSMCMLYLYMCMQPIKYEDEYNYIWKVKIFWLLYNLCMVSMSDDWLSHGIPPRCNHMLIIYYIFHSSALVMLGIQVLWKRSISGELCCHWLRNTTMFSYKDRHYHCRSFHVSWMPTLNVVYTSSNPGERKVLVKWPRF